MIRFNAKKITLMSLLTALALIIFVVELQIPTFIPIPGVKLGLANIITVYAMFTLNPFETAMILLCRIVLGAIFSASGSTILFSLVGGIFCYLLMLVARKILTKKLIWVCSIFGAIAHNIGQILVAALIMQTTTVFFYLPFLLISGIITGIFTGLCAQSLINRLSNRNFNDDK